jgi:O-antigen/teichoic acid export membrane protein
LKKKFITNLALLLLLNFLIKPFWVLGIDRTVQNIVGAEEYGFYFSLFNFSLLLNIILDVGITNFNNRNIAQYQQLLSKYFSNIVILKFLLALVYFIVSLFIALIIGYTWKQFQLLLFLILNQFIASFILYLRSNISGLHLFKTDSLISVLDRVIMILICGVILWGNVTQKPFRIEWFVYAQTAAYSMTLVFTFFIVLYRAEFFKPRFDRKFLIIILRQSYPFALLGLLMILYNRIDSVMLERLLTNGKEQAGIYAQGFRILDAASMVGFLFAGLLLPMFSRMIKQKDSVEQLTQFSFLLIIIPAIIVSLASVFYKSEIMNLLYRKHISVSADIFGVLMIGFIAICSSYIFGTLLTANGNLKEFNLLAGLGAVLNIILNVILIPKYFAYGSAIASLATHTITAISQALLVYFILKFSFNLKLIFKLLGFTFSIFLLGIFLKKINIEWSYSIIALLGVGIVLAFSFRLLSLKFFYHIIRYGDTV